MLLLLIWNAVPSGAQKYQWLTTGNTGQRRISKL